MKYVPRPAVSLPAFAARPTFSLAVGIEGLNRDYRIEDGSGMLYGQIYPNSQAAILWVNAQGGGRGSYLTGAFMEDAVQEGARVCEADAIHPGTIAVLGKILGPENLQYYLSDRSGDTAYTVSFKDALHQLSMRQEDIAREGSSSIRAIKVVADLGVLAAGRFAAVA